MKPHEVTQPGRYRWRWVSRDNDRSGECDVLVGDSGRLRLSNGLYLDTVATQWPYAAVTMERVTVRVLVCGGRDYPDCNRVYAELDRLHASSPITVVIQGGANGADWWAASWAEDNKVSSLEFPANWKKHGRSAGPIRNQQMIDEAKPDLVVAFPGGDGTEGMIRLASAAGVRVVRVS